MSTEPKRIKASEVVEYVTGVIAAGELAWPVPRSTLKGLRLKQVLDAFKIHMAEIYMECLRGEQDIAMYDEIRKTWPWLIATLPVVFTRNSEWEIVEHLTPEQRQAKLTAIANLWVSMPVNRNAEEAEFYNDAEPLSVFLDYVETVAVMSDQPFEHVLEHISDGTVYFDNTIPVQD
jgi:hypothetical protein